MPRLHVRKYFKGRKRNWTTQAINSMAFDLDKWVEDTNKMLLESWLEKHRLTYEHFNLFCERSERFRDSYTRARITIDRRLVEAALTRKIDVNALKFYLCNRSNWREKPDIQITQNVSLTRLLDDIDGASKNIIEVKPQNPKLIAPLDNKEADARDQ